MQKPILKFKLLSVDARLPSYAHATDAGFDIYTTDSVSLAPGTLHVFKTGLSSEIPLGWYVQLFDKSGLAAKFGFKTLGGVIDSGYRGEWGVIGVNMGNGNMQVEAGDKIAQGILLPVTQAEIVKAEELVGADRGEKGFGSTGKK